MNLAFCLGLCAAALAAVSGTQLAFAADYSANGFSVSYPDSWDVDDRWSSSQTLRLDAKGPYGLTIQYGPNPYAGQEVGRTLIEGITAFEQGVCRDNERGICWSFDVQAQGPASVGGQRAASVKYTMTLEDEPAAGQSLHVPDGDSRWYIYGAVHPNKTAVLDSVIGSFIPKELEPAPPAKGRVYNAPIRPVPQDDSVFLEKTIRISLILAGAQWSGAQQSAVLAALPAYSEPAVYSASQKTGIRYLFEYEFASATAEESRWLADAMEIHSEPSVLYGTDHGAPVWQAQWAAQARPEWVITDGTGDVTGYTVPYRQIDAQAVEEHLYNTLVAGDAVREAPENISLIFIASGPNQVGYMHSYYVENSDKATGKKARQVGLMGYGGAYNMHFFDLYAVPWLDWDYEKSAQYVPEWEGNLHDCRAHSCLAGLAAYHAKSAISHIVTPYFVYPPEYHQSYLLDLVVYTKSGDAVLITENTVGDFVNEQAMLDQLHWLFPMSEWSIDTTLEQRNSRGITYDFKQQINRVEHNVYQIRGEEVAVNLLHSAPLQPYLLGWAEGRKGGTLQTAGDTVRLPVLIIVDDAAARTYVDRYGTLGYAPARLDDPSLPCCAMGVADQNDIVQSKIGFTDLALHELGHVLGLAHPFSAPGSYSGYFNWYSSPMTYSFPPQSCGVLYDAFGPDQLCGNPSLSFTETERQRIADAHVKYILAEAVSNIQNMDSESAQRAVSSAVLGAVSSFESGSSLDPGGAMDLALEARKLSRAVSGNEGPDAPQVAPWARDVAGWWLQGEITDEEFAGAMSYLVEQGAVELGAPAYYEDAEQGQIPAWFRTVVEWWSQGLVPDSDFASALWQLRSSGAIVT